MRLRTAATSGMFGLAMALGLVRTAEVSCVQGSSTMSSCPCNAVSFSFTVTGMTAVVDNVVSITQITADFCIRVRVFRQNTLYTR